MEEDVHRANVGTTTTTLTFADLETSSVPVYEQETVGEFCKRLTGVSGSTELLWGTTYLPDTEIIQALTIAKPWQIDLKGGKERLLLRVPAGSAPSAELLKYMTVKSSAGGEGAKSSFVVASAAPAQVKRKRDEAKLPSKTEPAKVKVPEVEAATESKKSAEVEEVEKRAPPAPNVITERNLSIDEYDKVQRKMNKSGKKTIKSIAPVPKAVTAVSKFAEPRMNHLKDAILSNAGPSGKQPMRALKDIYGDSPVRSPKDELLGNRVERNVQTVSRVEEVREDIASLPVSEPISPRAVDADMDLAEQLTILANSTIPDPRPPAKKASKKKQLQTNSRARELLLNQNLAKIAEHIAAAKSKDDAMQPTLVESAQHASKKRSLMASTQGLPGQVPLSNIKAVIVQTGSVLEAFERIKRSAKISTDMSKMQENTIGAFYFMTAAGLALQSVTLVPSRYVDTNFAAFRPSK